MKRSRKMLIILGILVLLTVVAFIAADGTFVEKKYASIWKEDYIKGLKDTPSKILAGAIKASSSHNMQPWLVQSVGNNVYELYADMKKALKTIDPENTQMLMGHGAFIESYVRSANSYGYRVNMEYITPDFSNERPLIARWTLTEDASVVQPDVITSSSFHQDEANEDSKEIIAKLDEIIKEKRTLQYEIIEQNEIEAFQKMLLKGTVIESQDQKAMEELLSVFRWTEWDKNATRYGLTLNTLPSFMKPIIQPIMKITAKDWRGFGQQGIKAFKQRLKKEHRYILLKCNHPDAMDYLHTGEVYQSILYDIHGYILRPAVQVLETFDAMKALNQEFQAQYGVEGEVVLIIGLQDESKQTKSRTPRLLVEDILIP